MSRRTGRLRRSCAVTQFESLEERRLLSLVAPPTVPAPVIPTGTYTITSYGATTGSSNNAADIQAAINAALAKGGGTVVVPSGTFMSGPITLGSHINLDMAAGSKLEALAKTSWPSDTTDFIIAPSGSTDLEVSGSGDIDGNGATWWPKAGTRPKMIVFPNATRVLITGVTISNSPMEHIQIQNFSSDVMISHVTITAASTSPNTDGMDLSGSTIVVENCNISDGDDDVAIGATDASTNTWETNGVWVLNNTIGYGHGTSIGSHTEGNVENVYISANTYNGGNWALRIKSDATNGGKVNNVNFYNDTVTNVEDPIVISEEYDHTTKAPLSSTATLPLFSNITFSGVTITGSSNLAFISGLPDAIIQGITFNACNFSTDKGFTIQYAGTTAAPVNFTGGTVITMTNTKNPVIAFEYDDVLTNVPAT
jgi:polygalacturonase